MSIEELYDRHAACLYAIALRIAGNESDAAAALEEAFLGVAAGTVEASKPALVRAVRDRSLARQPQNASAPVDTSVRPTPRQLVEQAFYRGATAAELARTYSLPESEVRTMLRDGMAELRHEFAAAGTK